MSSVCVQLRYYIKIKGLKVLVGRSFEHIDKGGKPIRLGFKWLGQVREVVNNITKH